MLSRIYLYSDYEKQNSVGTINGITKDSVNNNANNTDDTVMDASKYANLPKVFNIEEYKDKCGTITYNLKLGEKGYYFVSSEVKK